MSKTFGSKVAVDAADLANRSFGEETNDVRSDVNEALGVLEARTALAKVDWIDGTGVAAAGGDITLQGRDLLAGQTFDELDIDTTYGLIITALKPGDTEYTVVIVSGGATDIDLTGTVLTITFNDGTDDDDAIATAINADAAATNGLIRATSSSSKNAAAWTAAGAMASTPMTGGAGAGFVCRVGGTEALPQNTTGITGAAAISDTQAKVTVPNLTADSPAKAATDLVTVNIESDGVVSNSLQIPLA